MPPQWTQPGSYSNLGPTRTSTIEEIVAQLENEPVADKKEGLALTLCHSACIRGDFNQAEKLALYINDPRIRARVRTLIEFYHAARFVEEGDLTSARQTANKMGSGVEPAILWLAIGRRYLEARDKGAASEALIVSLQLARSLDRSERAAILTAVAGQFGRFDTTMAMQTLAEAVHTYNSIEAEDYKPFPWALPVRAGDREVRFSLGVKSLERGFAFALERIVSGDADGAAFQVLKLKNERLLGESLVALSAALLKSAGDH